MASLPGAADHMLGAGALRCLAATITLNEGDHINLPGRLIILPMKMVIGGGAQPIFRQTHL